jgi:hypothetical protein
MIAFFERTREEVLVGVNEFISAWTDWFAALRAAWAGWFLRIALQIDADFVCSLFDLAWDDRDEQDWDEWFGDEEEEEEKYGVEII